MRPDFNEIISCTTRPMREKEVHGVNYYYYTDKEFFEKVNNNQMLEYTNFNNWYYGTSYDTLNIDKINIGVFNPAGIISLKNRNDIDLTVLRVITQQKERLIRQLCREGNPDVDEIIRRYQTDKQDFANLDFPFIQILNYGTEPIEVVAQDTLNRLDFLPPLGEID